MVLFFTLPPKDIPWPYVLCNARNINKCINYIHNNINNIRAIILDSGIEVFRDPNIKNYPGGREYWINRLVNLYKKLQLVSKGQVFVTCPDYCDDYNPRSLWVSEDFTNIERTVENILYCVDNYPEVNWLIPIQGHNSSPNSIISSIALLQEFGITKKYDYYGLANLCVERKKDILIETVKLASRLLKGKRIHVFGPKLPSLPGIQKYIYSFDSTAWTRPSYFAIKYYIEPNKKPIRSCWNTFERKLYFLSWILTAIYKYNIMIDGINVKKYLELFLSLLAQ